METETRIYRYEIIASAIIALVFAILLIWASIAHSIPDLWWLIAPYIIVTVLLAWKALLSSKRLEGQIEAEEKRFQNHPIKFVIGVILKASIPVIFWLGAINLFY